MTKIQKFGLKWPKKVEYFQNIKNRSIGSRKYLRKKRKKNLTRDPPKGEVKIRFSDYFLLLIAESILIPKWAHPPPNSARLIFYDRSKVGPTRVKWPKIDQKTSKCDNFLPFSLNFLTFGHLAIFGQISHF